MTERRKLERLLRPRSVAVIGASPTPGSLGASVLANLERMRFAGEIHLVNPGRSQIGARPCLPSVAALPMDLDVAVLAIPRAAVLDTVRSLATQRVGAAVIFAAGYAEGGTEGRDEQRDIARVARDAGMVLEGPNCLGLVNYIDGIALTFVETPAVALGDRRGIAIVSQSGAMAAVLGVMLTSRELGLSYSISTGNEALSGVEDFIEYLLDDPHTVAIGMIVEQFRQPARFLSLARRARQLGKHVVILHPGRSSAARASAATHTGALAGDYQTMRVKVEREGVIVADSLEELGDLLELVVRCAVLPSGGAAVMTESGAFKALTLDLCEQIGLTLPSLSAEDVPLLRAALPAFVPVANPLDLTAQALVDPGLYGRALSALLADQRFGSVTFAIIQTDAVTSALKFPPIIAAIKELKPDKTVVFAGLDEGAAVPTLYIEQLRALGVPYFPSADRAFRAIAQLNARAARDFSVVAQPPARLDALPVFSGIVPEYRAKQMLTPAGIPFPAGRVVTTLEQARAAAAALGFPVVLKAQSVALPHKSDVGGVVVGLHDPAALEEGWQRLHASIARHRLDLKLEGVLVETMGSPGVEFIVGARNDPQWGVLILAGFGGVQSEILKDVRLLAPDLTREAIRRELDLLKSATLLRGFRGSPALDVEALSSLIMTLGAVLHSNPRIVEIDLNPVVLYPQGRGVLALDALMNLSE